MLRICYETNLQSKLAVGGGLFGSKHFYQTKNLNNQK